MLKKINISTHITKNPSKEIKRYLKTTEATSTGGGFSPERRNQK